MEHFFEENTHGILETDTLLLPIWEDSNESLCYLFDPKPRGPNGLGYEENGVACVLSFNNAKVMYDHILNLLDDPEARQGEFILTPVDIIVGDTKTKKKVRTRRKVHGMEEMYKTKRMMEMEERRRQLREYVSVGRRIRHYSSGYNYNHHNCYFQRECLKRVKREKAQYMVGRGGYHELAHGFAILRGMRSQASCCYTPNSRNKQDIPNCIVAYVMSRLQPIDMWHHKHIDLILDVGEQLYIDSYITYGPKDPMLGLKNVLRKFYLNDVKVSSFKHQWQIKATITIINPFKVRIGIFRPLITDSFLLSNLMVAYTNLFQQENFGLLNACGKWVAVFFKAGYYYVFYPRDTDLTGSKVPPGKGWAACVRYPTIKDLAWALLMNMIDTPSDPIGSFQITTLFVKDVRRVRDISKMAESSGR